MKRMRLIILYIVCLSLSVAEVRAQEQDSIEVVKEVKNPYRFNLKQMIIPVTLLGIGIAGLESDWLKSQDRKIRDEVKQHVRKNIPIDDYSQYAPMVAAYGLELCGVKGKHDLVDKTIILATAYAIMGASVNGIKLVSKVERPDGSSRNSFPSGHTATAFMGAEFLRKEYQETLPWVGIAGYTVAIGTGVLRMYNNRHWLTDVLAGAGIGILSTKAAYWLYPVIAKTFFKKRAKKNIFISPTITAQEKGVYCQIIF